MRDDAIARSYLASLKDQAPRKSVTALNSPWIAISQWGLEFRFWIERTAAAAGQHRIGGGCLKFRGKFNGRFLEPRRPRSSALIVSLGPCRLPGQEGHWFATSLVRCVCFLFAHLASDRNMKKDAHTSPCREQYANACPRTDRKCSSAHDRRSGASTTCGRCPNSIVMPCF